MQRIVIHKPGGYQRLVLEEAPDPEPQAGEVLVATEAVGVNYADCVVRRGLYESAKKYVGWPITPGFEFAGRVVAIGQGIADLTIAEPVFGLTRFGGYATHVIVPRHQLFRLPRDFDMARAACFPTVHLTAWYALSSLAHAERGEWVLIHSAAGGVGTAALALARHLGLISVAVVGSAHKVEVARSLGASFVIDRSAMDLWRETERICPDGFQIVLESNGVGTLRQSYRCLKPTGRLIAYGLSSMAPKADQRTNWLKLAWHYLLLPRFHPLQLMSDNKTVSGFNLSHLFEHETMLARAMSELVRLAELGALPAPPIREYPLEQAGKAHRDLETGQTVGKLVLRPTAKN